MAQVEVKLSDTDSQRNSTAQELDSLQAEAESLDATVKQLAEQLEFIKNSDIRGERFLCKHSVLDMDLTLCATSFLQFFQEKKIKCLLTMLKLFLIVSKSNEDWRLHFTNVGPGPQKDWGPAEVPGSIQRSLHWNGNSFLIFFS